MILKVLLAAAALAAQQRKTEPPLQTVSESERVPGYRSLPNDFPPEPAYGSRSPAYPEAARARGDEGTVRIRLQVTAEGRPERVEVAGSSGCVLLDRSAVRTVQGWTFLPALKGGKPVAAPLELEIEFKLETPGN